MSGEEQSGVCMCRLLGMGNPGSSSAPWQEITRLLLFGAQLSCLWSILPPALWSQHFPGTGCRHLADSRVSQPWTLTEQAI